LKSEIGNSSRHSRWGAFSSLTTVGNFGRAQLSLSYDAHDVFLTIAVPPPRTPTISVSNDPAAIRGEQVALSDLVTIADPDGVGFQKLELWDSNGTVAGGQFVVNGTPQTGGHEIDVSPADVANPMFDVGTLGGMDTLWARLLQTDGTLTNWQQFTVTAPIDTPPMVTVANKTATHGQSFAASSLFTASDPDGDILTQYDFWDTGAGGGHFVLNGAAQGNNQEIDVTAAQLSQLSYLSGSGADTLWVRVSDGDQWSAWSQSFTVTAPFDPGPLATPTRTNVVAAHGQSFAASSLFTANDPFGDAITDYDFWDSGTGGGHFVLNGQTLGANQDNYISASQLPQTTYQSGSGTDTLWVRANDGTVWGAWSQAFTVTAPVDSGPVVTPVSNIHTTVGQIFAASNLFTASDPFGDPIEQYDFWDTGTGGGRFMLNGQALGTNQNNYVSAAQLAQASYVSGSGTDTLWVRVSEGGQWSPWSPSFTVSDPTTIGAGETLELASAYSERLSFAADTGTLKLDDAASFSGTVAGMAGQDTINFADIDSTKVQAPSYSGEASGGTLSVTDGTHTANIALLGSYLASTFVASSDGHGGTNVVEHAPTDHTSLLAQPQH
jgi:hypothetical protein